MSLHTWWVFVGTTFLVSSTPGPNMLHILTRSVRFGLRRSMPAMAGCGIASGATMAAAGAGLGAVLAASPAAFEVIRSLGIAYLLYLGASAWRSGAGTTAYAPAGADRMSAGELFRGGFLVSVSNPKLLLYASSVIPQFVDPSASQAPQLSILVLTFVVGDVFWYAVYAYGGERLSRHLSRPVVRRAFDRAADIVFVLFGVALLFERPA